VVVVVAIIAPIFRRWFGGVASRTVQRAAYGAAMLASLVWLAVFREKFSEYALRSPSLAYEVYLAMVTVLPIALVVWCVIEVVRLSRSIGKAPSG
jgi:hypothetical protein